ncbi:MAG: lipopolysaccharide biosynthesis protein [Clostridia bacterium]|nr:lipopolysaccharide biosynthesis protein [Clostridia bacterium]
MGNSHSSTAISGAAWRFAERIFAQLITFCVSIVLARLLSPDEYGLIAIVTVFITLANICVADGLSASIVQKKQIDSLDYSTVLYGGFVLSLIIYAVLFFCAPLIAKFYNAPILSPVFRVLSLRIPLASINSVEGAYLSRNLQFKKFFWATLGGTAFSGVVGITMAFSGFGIWALVGQNLTNYFIDTIILALVIKKVPPLRFSFTRMKELFSFGGKILVTNLIFQLVSQLRTLIIGKKYSTSDLSFYTKGQYFPNLIGSNISAPLSSVLFPILAKMQSNVNDIKTFLRKSVHLISYTVSPLLIGLAAVSRPLITILLTEKWLPCVNFIWYGAIYHSFTSMHSTNLEAVKAIGAGNQIFKYGNIKRIISIVTLLATFWINVDAIAIGLIASAILCTAVNMYQNKKLFYYSYTEQLIDFLPNMFCTWVMGITVFLLGKALPFSNIITLILQVITGVIIYLALSVITKNKSLNTVIHLIKDKLKK